MKKILFLLYSFHFNLTLCTQISMYRRGTKNYFFLKSMIFSQTLSYFSLREDLRILRGARECEREIRKEGT